MTASVSIAVKDFTPSAPRADAVIVTVSAVISVCVSVNEPTCVAFENSFTTSPTAAYASVRLTATSGVVSELILSVFDAPVSDPSTTSISGISTLSEGEVTLTSSSTSKRVGLTATRDAACAVEMAANELALDRVVNAARASPIIRVAPTWDKTPESKRLRVPEPVKKLARLLRAVSKPIAGSTLPVL